MYTKSGIIQDEDVFASLITVHQQCDDNDGGWLGHTTQIGTHHKLTLCVFPVNISIVSEFSGL
jgi:hypothetical protein